MTIGVILLLFAVAIVVAIIVANPFIQTQKGSILQPNQQRSTLLAEKERLIKSIEELEFDHLSGKIPDQLFENQRKHLMVQTATVLEKLKGFPAELSVDIVNGSIPASGAAEYDQLEELIAKRRVALQQKSKGFCQKCGQAVLDTDRFCPKCGTVLQKGDHD
jgi:hypothetical protein